MVHIFDHLAVEFPEKAVFFRLGGHCAKTGLDERSRLQFMQISRRAFALCEPCGRWSVLKISSAGADCVETEKGILILGKDFCKTAQNASYLWCGAATIGNRLVALRDELDSVAASAVCDAVGSECADAAMDMLYGLSRSELLRNRMILSERRFSPGYGDMPLSLQNFFYSELDMAQMEVTLNENNFFIPEKTVTAFAFIHTL